MNRIRNRYAILVIASMVNFVHGNPYIWTVFQPYVREEYGLSVAASSQPFTIIIGIFALGNIMGGCLQHKIGAKRTILFGSVIMCVGFFLAGLAPVSMPWMISLGYGALGGLGSGCAFSMLVAVPQGWFPDKRGLVTGITIGVVGVSGVIMNPLCDMMLAHYGYQTAMLLTTLIYAVLCLGAFFIEEAPEKLQLGGQGEADVEEVQKQYTTSAMMRTKVYYILSLIMALSVPAYVLVNPLMKSLGMERGLSSGQALLGVTIASGANILGRFVSPWLSDRVGSKIVVQVMYLAAGISVIGLVWAQGGLFVLLISIVCMVYGSVVSVFPVLVCGRFGMKYQGSNLGAIMIGYGIVSVLCPYLLGAAGQELSFLIAGAACFAGFVGTQWI